MRRHPLPLVLALVTAVYAAMAPVLAEGPASEATTHDAAGLAAPVQDAPTQNGSDQDAPAQDARAQDAPAQDTTASVPGPRSTVREQTCLSSADLREAVAEQRVVEPIAAIRAARDAVPRAEIVRVNLCHREGEVLVYVITALRKNGRFVHVTVDSRSGAVDSLQ